MEEYPHEEYEAEHGLVGMEAGLPEGDEGALPAPDADGETEGILPYLSEKFPQKVEKVFQRFLEELTAHGMTEEVAKDNLLQQLMNQPAFEYTIWRIILTESDFQDTEEEIQESQEAGELFDWLQVFGGGQTLDDQTIDILLCNYFPNRYQELMDFLESEYPEVQNKDFEFHFLKNKVRKQAERLNDGSEAGEEVQDMDDTIGKQKASPTLRQVNAEQRGSLGAARPPILTKNNGRTRWLYENARIARMYNRRWYGNLFKSFISEIGMSVGFRVYMTMWFVCATIFAVFFGFHEMFTLFHRLFSPEEFSFLSQVAIFSCILLGVVFLGSYFTALDRVLKGWIFMDDETYYGDEDWSKTYNDKLEKEGDLDLDPVSNPVERTRAMHLIPGVKERTFMLLPGGRKGYYRREFWLGVIVISSTIAPFFYATITAAVDSENVYTAVGHFVHFNLMSAVVFTYSYWLYMWYFGLRKKYAAYKRNKGLNKTLKKGEKVPYAQDQDYLCEWGLDERSVRRNIFTIGLTIAPLLLMFWVGSYNSIKVTVPWIITAGVIVVVLLCLREVWRSEVWQDRMYYVVLVLLLVFFGFSFAGAIAAKSSVIAVFVLLLFMTQLLLIRHRPIANVDEVTWLFEYIKKIQMNGGGVMSPTPAGGDGEGLEPKTPGQQQRDKKKKLRKTLKLEHAITAHTDPNREGSFIPLNDVFAAFTDMPCLNRCFGNNNGIDEDTLPVPDHTKRGWWRLSDRYWGDVAEFPTIEARGRCEPTEKLILTMSPKLAGWFMLVFFIFVFIALVVGGDVDGPAATLLSVDASRTEGLTPMLVRPPICRLNFGTAQMSINDLALLTWLSSNTAIYNILELPRLFNRTERVHLVNFVYEEQKFYHYYVPSTGESYITMRQEAGAVTRMRDLDMWGESMLFGVMSTVIPFIRFFSEDLAHKVVDQFTFLKTMLDPTDNDDDVLAKATAYIHLWKAGVLDLTYDTSGSVVYNGAQTPIVMLGHGTNGGVARLVAARFGLPAITFNSPGTRWLLNRYLVPDNSHNEINVLSTNDLSSIVGMQSGARQYT